MISQGNVFASAYPGLTLRAWALVSVNGVDVVTLLSGLNVTSVTDAGPSNVGINFTVNMQDTFYIADAGADNSDVVSYPVVSRAVGSCQVTFKDAAGSALLKQNKTFYIAIYR